eukprot:gb/GEZN01006744.1/.p1 GENE.gb/GEZN01006744.1/~~gb/GEZN01006744.1/.p1  ORF type:complete len:455 (-),score=50.92 gb/GEZN01006744.1/:155-1519(-)
MSAKGKLRLIIQGGDNMLGRGVQLTLPVQSQGDAHIRDSCPAWYYLQQALHRSSIETQWQVVEGLRIRNKDGNYTWGDLLSLKLDPAPHLRLLNLETAVTADISDPWPLKGINYHLHSENLKPLFSSLARCSHELKAEAATAPMPTVIVFSNNHVLDFGRRAFLQESLPALRALEPRVMSVGAGTNITQAQSPVTVTCGSNKVLVNILAFSAECSGTPRDWGASDSRAGLVWLPGLTSNHNVLAALNIISKAVGQRIKNSQEHGAILIVSIHWGPNWAYRGARTEESDGQPYRRMLARKLVAELGVDMIYGHSSHHIRGMETYQDKLIIYGAGDFINDYEGFKNPGDEAYCHAGALFVVDLNEKSGKLEYLELIPTYMDQLSLRVATGTTETKLWDPILQRSVSEPDLAEKFAKALNQLSHLDAGRDGEAVLLQVTKQTQDPKRGPILTQMLKP